MATSNHRDRSSRTFEDTAGEDRDRTVQLAYEAMTRRLVDRLDLSAETHWELLDAVETAGFEGDALDALRRLTVIYERAVFAPETVRAEDAQWAVAVATRFEELTE